MNPFYRRLITFGQLVQHLSLVNKTNYKDCFEIEHPGFVAFTKPKKIRPALKFVNPCPNEDKNRIIDLFNKCFDEQRMAS